MKNFMILGIDFEGRAYGHSDIESGCEKKRN